MRRKEKVMTQLRRKIVVLSCALLLLGAGASWAGVGPPQAKTAEVGWWSGVASLVSSLLHSFWSVDAMDADVEAIAAEQGGEPVSPQELGDGPVCDPTTLERGCAGDPNG